MRGNWDLIVNIFLMGVKCVIAIEVEERYTIVVCIKS